MTTEEKGAKAAELKQLLETKGIKAGLFYSNGGPSGLKLTLAEVEKLLQLLG